MEAKREQDREQGERIIYKVTDETTGVLNFACKNAQRENEMVLYFLRQAISKFQFIQQCNSWISSDWHLLKF